MDGFGGAMPEQMGSDDLLGRTLHEELRVSDLLGMGFPRQPGAGVVDLDVEIQTSSSRLRFGETHHGERRNGIYGARDR
jgi:hypothetical protein